jgi:hypothetical protein
MRDKEIIGGFPQQATMTCNYTCFNEHGCKMQTQSASQHVLLLQDLFQPHMRAPNVRIFPMLRLHSALSLELTRVAY